MLAETVQKMGPQELLDRRELVRARMGELSSNGGEDTQTLPGSKEVHWDHVMKEMVSWCVVNYSAILVLSTV